MTKNLLSQIVDWFDWKIYWLFYKVFNRMLIKHPAWCYLVYLNIGKWFEENPLDEKVKKSADIYFNSLPQNKK